LKVKKKNYTNIESENIFTLLKMHKSEMYTPLFTFLNTYALNVNGYKVGILEGHSNPANL